MWWGSTRYFLQIDAVIPKGILGLPPGGVEGVGQLFGPVDQAHALAAAPRRGLDQQGEADLLGRGDQVRVILAGLEAGDHGHARRHHGRPGRGLGPHAAHGVRAGADEDQPGVRHGLGEVGVFG